MGHDATKVLLGTTGSSDREGAKAFDSDPASFPAGKAVSLTSAGVLSLAAADGMRIGISLGRSLSNTKKTAVLRAGLRVPILLEDELVPVVGELVYVDDVTGLACADDSEDGTVTQAVYVSAVLTGVLEDDTTANVALIDMPGGL
jgi:hypothetical protein